MRVLVGIHPLASALAEPLEVVAVILSVSGFHAGIAGAIELARGGTGESIQAQAAKAAAAGFIVGIPICLAAGFYVIAN